MIRETMNKNARNDVENDVGWSERVVTARKEEIRKWGWTKWNRRDSREKKEVSVNNRRDDKEGTVITNSLPEKTTWLPWKSSIFLFIHNNLNNIDVWND